MASETSVPPDPTYIVNITTPRHTLLSALYKQSFAYKTMRFRLPEILNNIVAELGEESREEMKHITGQISKLKYQLQTDKALEQFDGKEHDKEDWNQFIENLGDEKNSFFKTCWLYAECYIYRRLSSFFENSLSLSEFDYFAKQKRNALVKSIECIEEILNVVQGIDCTTSDSFKLMLKLNLWGNRCDLSITSGKEVQLEGNPFDLVRSFDHKIIIDDSSFIIECLKSENSIKPAIVEFICDNAGYELFTDFVLADYLIKSEMADKVRFNLKAIPWFISDATINDFNWTLQFLQNHSVPILKEYGMRWQRFLNESKFEIAPLDYFWTSPYEYYRMRDVNPNLYARLSEANLIIFKGDLNYRKLIGDFSWDFTESFTTCLRDFRPTNICSLRTVKADLICGLAEGQADMLKNKSKDWMITGDYGTIQFAEKCGCLCSKN